MPAARVHPVSAVLAQLLVEQDGEWRPVLLVRGPDAEARAQDLRRLVEAGLVAPAAALADPAGATALAARSS